MSGFPGDELIPRAPLSWDRGGPLPAPPEAVWPWLVQLGARRAGWYLPARVERLLPPRGRALRRIDPAFQDVTVGDRVPDYGPGGWFEARVVDRPHALVWWSRRQRGLEFSWALVLSAHGEAPAGGDGDGDAPAGGTNLQIRIRMNRHLGRRARPLLEGGGELLDRAFISLMVAGLRERLRS